MTGFHRRRRRETDTLTRMMRDAHRREPPDVDIEAALADIHRRAALEGPRTGKARLWQRPWVWLPMAAIAVTAVLCLTIGAWGGTGAPVPPERSWHVADPAPQEPPGRETGPAGSPAPSPGTRPGRVTAATEYTPLGALPLAGDPPVTPALGPVDIGGRPFEDGWQIRLPEDVSASMEPLSFVYPLDGPSSSLQATVGVQGTAKDVAACVWTLSTDKDTPSLTMTVGPGRVEPIRYPLTHAATLSIKVSMAGRKDAHAATPTCSMGDPRVAADPETKTPAERPGSGVTETGAPSPAVTPPTTPPRDSPPATPPTGPNAEPTIKQSPGPDRTAEPM